MLKNIIKYHVKITTMKCFWVIYQTSITASRFVNSAVSRRNHEDRFFHYLIRFNLRFNPKLNQEMIDFSPLASNKLRGLGFKLQMTKYFDELVFYDSKHETVNDSTASFALALKIVVFFF